MSIGTAVAALPAGTIGTAVAALPAGTIGTAVAALPAGTVGTVAAVLSTPVRQWVATAAVLFGVVAASFGIRQVGRWLRTEYDPRGSMLEAIQAALIVALAAGATAAVLLIWGENDIGAALASALEPEPSTVIRLLVTFFLLLGAWGATVFVERVISVVAAENNSLTRHQQEVGYNVAKVGLYLLAVVAAVAAWGIRIGDVLLGAGFLSVVLGLAARQTLASVLAGFILLFGRPFDIGDWIVVDDQEGVITDVSIFNTELRTVNGEFVVIPNDVVTNTSLVNRSRRGRLRVDVEVGVDYDTDLDRARELATEAVADRAGDVIQDVPEPKTVLVRFDDSAVVLETRFWIDDPSAERRWEAQTQAVTAIRQAFEAAEITIPFPQRTLNQRLSEDPEDER